MIELKTWAVLAAFYEEGTLMRASERLHITQPALSLTLKRLEEELSVTLFDRSRKNRLVLTERGIEAAKMAQQLLAQSEHIEQSIKNSDELCIGICAPVPEWQLQQPVHNYFGRKARFDLSEDIDFLRAGLRSGKYQLAVLPQRPEDEEISARYWMSEKLYLAVPCEHPLSRKTVIGLDDLKHQNLLLYRSIGYWNEIVRERLPETSFLSSTERSTFIEAAGLGAFPYFVSPYAKTDSDTVEIHDLEGMECGYWLVWRKDDVQMKDFVYGIAAI